MGEDERGELTRRDMMRAAGAAGALFTMPGLLAACGGAESSGDTDTVSVGGRGTGADIPSITWALPSAPTTLDIATGFARPGVLTMMLGLEGLVSVGRDLKLQPQLAESWSRVDPLRYVYTIRSGVTFWDGSPMTIDDVEYSVARHLDPKTASQLSTYFLNVKSVEATGDNELTVSLKRPDPLFQYIPTLTFVTPKAYSERLGSKLGTPGPKVNTMGTGPYEITSFSTDDGITLKRREDYWGEKPRVAAATLKYITDAQTQLLAARSGEIDGMYGFSPGQGPQWDRSNGVNTQYARGMTVSFLAFDTQVAPWNDVHVRRAVAHAADRAGYVRAFLAGHGEPAPTLVSPLQWAELSSVEEVEKLYASFRQYENDIDKAKDELAQSAHAGGFSAEVAYPSIYPEAGRSLVSLSEALKPIGIELRVKEITYAAWAARIYAHEDLGLTYAKYGADYVDPADFPAIMFDSQKAVANQFNIANYKNPKVDALLAKQAETTDDAVRVQSIGEMLRIAADELPYLPLFWEADTIGLGDKYVYEDFKAIYQYNPGWLGRIGARA